MLERNNPESLTNEIINQIGRDYLAKYPESSLRHSNQKTATSLANYSESSASREKWAFLFNELVTLDRGELSTAICDLFNVAFETRRKLTSNLYDNSLQRAINDHYSFQLHAMVKDIHQQLHSQVNARPSSLLAARSFLNTLPNVSAVVNPELDPLSGRFARIR